MKILKDQSAETTLYVYICVYVYIYILYIYIYISGDIFNLFLVLTYNLRTSAVLLFETLQRSADQMKILKDQRAETTVLLMFNGDLHLIINRFSSQVQITL